MDILGAIGTLLRSVPNVVWSGIVASVITVLGVLVTNLGLSKRHREQLAHTAQENARKLAHEASESALERKMKLRRDVYIPAIEGVYAATSALGSMAQPATQRDEAQRRFSEAVGLISKVNAVAGAETVSATGALLNSLMQLNLELSFKRAPIDDANGRVQANAQTVARAVGEHGRWVQVQTSLLFDGPPSAEKWNFVCAQIAFQQSQIDQWQAQSGSSMRDLHRAQLEFLKTMVELQPSVRDIAISASIALRKELGMLDEDQDELKQIMIKQYDGARKTMKAAIERLERQLNVSS
ncbi:hypothetical protein SAMN05444172_2623 [Burkholderia sp. GAS332]|nr:hypothetical protein SAMN05444172_2623 [Burkholderia sp. GAS332]